VLRGHVKLARISRLDPTLLLVLLTLSELVLNRLWSGRVAPAVHVYLAAVVGTLGALVFAVGLVRLCRRGDLLPAPARILCGAFGVAFLVPATLALTQPNGRMQVHARAGFIFLALGLGLALAARPVSKRLKLGLLLLVLPLCLHGWVVLSDMLPVLAPSWNGFGERVEGIAEMLVLTGGLFLPALFLSGAPERARGRGRALVLAFVVAAWYGILYFMGHSMGQLAPHAIGLRPPPTAMLAIAYMAAAFGFVLTVAALLLERGAHRVVGAGLAVVCLSGFDLAHPYQLLASAAGLLYVMAGALGADELV
jgi:hypothetical protein